MPPNSSICGFSLAAFVGFRAVAMTLFPARRATSAMAVPRPEDAPVTSHVLGAILVVIVIGVKSSWGAESITVSGSWRRSKLQGNVEIEVN